MNRITRISLALYLKLREHLLGFLIIVGSAVLLFRGALLTSGFLPGVDALDYFSSTSVQAREITMFYVWRGDIGFGFPTQFTWRLPLAIVDLLLGDAVLTLKLFSISCFLLAGFSMYAFTFHLTRRKLASAASSIIFIVNQFFIAKWANGFYHAGFAYALIPLLFYTLDAALRTRKPIWIVAFSIAYSSLFLTRYDPIIYITPFLILYAVFLVLKAYTGVMRISLLKDIFKVLFTIVALTSLFSAFILLPVLFGVRSIGATLEMKLPMEVIKLDSLNIYRSLLGYTSELSYLAWIGQLGVETHPFLPDSLYLFSMSVPVVLAFAALLFRRDRWTLFLASSALISVFLAKGFYPPFGEVYSWLYFNVPLMGALHAPNRWLMITYFAYAFLAGITMNAIYVKLQWFSSSCSNMLKTLRHVRRLPRVLPSMFVAALITFVILPVSGIMVEGFQTWRTPEDLVKAYTWFADQPGEYRIATVPYDQHRMWAYWEEETIVGQRIIVDDNHTGFWVNLNPNYVRLGDNLAMRADDLSKDSLMIDVHTPGRNTSLIIEHRFSSMEDWGGHKYLILWFKGQGKGLGFTFNVYFDSSYDNYVEFAFFDESRDWERIVFALVNPDALRGMVDWSKVSSIALSASNRTTTDTFHLDRVSLALELKNKGSVWPLQDLGAQSRFYHSKPVMGTGYGDGYPFSWDFAQYTNLLVLENRTIDLMKILGLFNIRYLLMEGYWPISVPKEYFHDFQHEFFLKQRGLKPIYSSSTSTIYENEFWVPHFFTVTKYAIVVGGRETLWTLTETVELDLGQYGLIFADQVVRHSGLNAFMKLMEDAQALIYVNSEPLDLAMLILEDAIRIKGAEYAYPSLDEYKHWIAKDWLISRGMPVLNRLALTTSGNNTCSIPFKVGSEGTYSLWVKLLHGPNRGNLTVSIDGKGIETVMARQPNYRFLWVNLGDVPLSQGDHTLTLHNKRATFGSENTVDEIVLVEPSMLESAIDRITEIDKSVIETSKIENTIIKKLMGGKVIVDDNETGFWVNSNPDYVSLSDDETMRTDELSKGSLKVDIHTPDRRAYSLMEHQFSSMEDWSEEKYLVLWFKGWNTGLGFTLEIYFDSSHNDFAQFQFRDSSTDWRRIVLPMFKPDHATGVIDWSKVWKIILSASDKETTGKFYLDRIARGRDIKEGGIQYSTLEGDGGMEFTVESEVDQMLIHLLKEADGGSSEVISSKQVNPTLYEIHVRADKPFFLMFSESYHPLWRAYVDGEEIESIPSYSFINGFHIIKTGDVKITVEFVGQRYVTYGLSISMASIGLTFTYFASRKWRRVKPDKPKVKATSADRV